MTGITDIHCHVLPHVDDGAKNTQTAIEMLSFMYDEGIDRAILTPHYHGGYMETDIGTVKEQFEGLKGIASESGKSACVELLLGNEIYYYPSIIEWLEEGKVLTLAGSDYVLLEFGFTMDKRSIVEGVANVANSGYIPIVAHVERYEEIVSDIAAVDELISEGGLIQINAEALYSGHRIKSFAKKLLKRDMVHFVATDAHNMEHRAPIISDAAEYISKHYGEECCQRLLVDNPDRVINNEYISI